MTAREQLLAVHAAVEEALQRRTELIVELRNEGYSLRQIGSVLGASASTVMRWGPLPDDNANARLSLDEERG